MCPPDHSPAASRSSPSISIRPQSGRRRCPGSGFLSSVLGSPVTSRGVSSQTMRPQALPSQGISSMIALPFSISQCPNTGSVIAGAGAGTAASAAARTLARLEKPVIGSSRNLDLDQREPVGGERLREGRPCLSRPPYRDAVPAVKPGEPREVGPLEIDARVLEAHAPLLELDKREAAV